MARTALTHVSAALPRSVWTESSELSKDLARELQAENDELSETNRQLIAAMEEMQSLNVTLQSVNEALHTANIELRSEVDTYRVRLADLEHMIDGIGVAAVLLNDSLEVRDYNASASRFFTLKKGDIGRSIARVRHDFQQTSLADLCREALDTGEPLERIATAHSGDLVSLRIREVDLGAPSSGLMLTIADITDLGLEPQTHFA